MSRANRSIRLHCFDACVRLATWTFALLALGWSGTGYGRTADPPGSPNAMSLYQQAFDWWNKNAKGDSAIFNEQELLLLGVPLEGNPIPEAQAAIAKAKPFIELVRAAGLTANYGLTLDRSQGVMLALPHLSSVRNAARVLRLDAEVRLASGDFAGATETLRAINGFSTHVRQDEILVSSLVSASIIGLNSDLIDRALGYEAIDAARAGELIAALEASRGPDPIRVADAIRSEFDLMRSSVTKALANGESLEGLLGETGGTIDKAELEPERIEAQLAAMDRLYAEAASAITNPDRDAARAVLAGIETRVEEGEAGILGKLLTAAFGKAADATWRVEDMIAEHYRILDDIRSGRATSAKYGNAAAAYLRAAAVVAGLDRDRQASIEAARLAADALDPKASEGTTVAIARLRDPLRVAFTEAASRERCNFAITREHRPNLIPSYLPGIRGALRTLYADAALEAAKAAHAARSQQSTPVNAGPTGGAASATALSADQPTPSQLYEDAIAFGLRAARHVASDPGIGHSVFAASILHEAASALDDAISRGLLSAEALTRLREVSARIPRVDPGNFAKAIDAERAIVAERLAFHGNQDEEKMLEMIGKRGDGLSFLLLLQQIRTACGRLDTLTPDSLEAALAPWKDEAVRSAALLGIGDLLPLASVEVACTRVTEWLAPALDPQRKDERDSLHGEWPAFVLRFSWSDVIGLSAARSLAATSLTRIDAALAEERNPPGRETPVSDAPASRTGGR
jgi:hypothetical protein